VDCNKVYVMPNWNSLKLACCVTSKKTGKMKHDLSAEILQPAHPKAVSTFKQKCDFFYQCRMFQLAPVSPVQSSLSYLSTLASVVSGDFFSKLSGVQAIVCD